MGLDKEWQNEILLAKAQALGCAYVLSVLLALTYEKKDDKKAFAERMIKSVHFLDNIVSAEKTGMPENVSRFLSDNAKIFAENIIHTPLLEGYVIDPNELN